MGNDIVRISNSNVLYCSTRESSTGFLSLLDPEAQEVERADRHRHPEGRVVRSDLLRSGPVGGHRNPRRESSEDPDETAR